MSVPSEAFDQGVSGRAVISCLLTDTGRLSECRLEREQPPGWRFGEVSLRAARDYRFDPGDAEPGTLVLLPVTWNITPDGR